MSQVDHFVEEVTEEVRRDKLYGLMRKYGWIAVLAVVLLVGGAALIEWQKARAQARAEALGDALHAALETGDVAALAKVKAQGDAEMIVTLLIAGEEAKDGALSDAARARLEALAGNSAAPARYRDLAGLKLAMLPGLAPQARIDRLTPLTQPGAPYRTLAEEQLAYAEIEKGDREAALTRLEALVVDAETTQALRRRVSQVMVSLGGTPATL